MPINWNCKALLFLRWTHVSSAIASVATVNLYQGTRLLSVSNFIKKPSTESVQNMVLTALHKINSRTIPGLQKYFPGPCNSTQQCVNTKTNTSYLLYIKERDSSMHTAMFTTVTCSKANCFYHCKNESQKTRGVRTWIFSHSCPHHCVCVPANSRTFQDL